MNDRIVVVSYRVEQLCGEAQVVVESQEGDSLETNHDDLQDQHGGD